MIKRIKKLLEELADSGGTEGISLAALAAAATGDEPDMRVVGLFSDVVDEKVAEIVHAMLYMNELNRDIKEPKDRRDIEFYLSTYGGSADDMFALYDMMKVIQQTTDISTIGMGKVMSAGVLILAGGTQGKRKIGRNCRVMLHSVIAGNQGSLHNLMNEMEAIQDLQEMYIDRLVEETKMTKKQLKKMLEQKVNIYLSAEQAVEHGIADEII
jgi:ATP-dependent Clp endopeptidase proteolytic subunit ClpP|tara:strand:- start:6597 stop:7232 length:636 start_codon:yes stop_codon:yes gene_type:complete